MPKILVFLTIVLCVLSNGAFGGSRSSKRTRSTGSIAISTTTARTVTTAGTVGKTETTRNWRTTDKHRHHHGITASSMRELEKTSTAAPTLSPRKVPLDEQEDLPIQVEPQTINRNARVSVIEKSPAIDKKSIEIELKAYTPPPNAPAIIEVLPDMSNTWLTPCNNQWPNVPCYPSQPNDQTQWSSNQYPYLYQLLYNQYVVPYLPTEQLLYTNTQDTNPVYLYPYRPIKSTIDPYRSARHQLDRLQGILYKNNQKLWQNPERQNEGDDTETTTEVPEPTETTTTPNAGSKKLLVNQQSTDQTHWIPYPEEVSRAFNINMGSAPGFKPGVLKFVTRSYQLKTHPKLEWVPL